MDLGRNCRSGPQDEAAQPMVRETNDGDFQYSFNRLRLEGGPETTANAAGDSDKASISPKLEAGVGSSPNLFLLVDTRKPAVA